MKKKLFSVISTLALIMSVLYPLGALPALAVSNNLISNPSLESQTDGQPDAWHIGQWGDNQCAFSYPAAGFDGSNGAKVDVSSYVNGDCKWYFDHVPVSANHNYQFSDKFNSDAPSELVAEYADIDGHLSYSLGIVIPASNGEWQSASATFAPPAGTVSMTIFHVLAHVGFLSIDEADLHEIKIEDPFNEGMVSLTFDDGFTDQYLNAFPKLKVADLKGTFYIATHSNQGLSIPNDSLELASGGLPMYWSHEDNSDASFDYPVAGHSGLAASVSSSVIDSGASWNFDSTAILPDLIYGFNEWYKSDANSELSVSLELDNGSKIKADITDINGNTLGQKLDLSSSADAWEKASLYFYAPANAKKVTVNNALKGIGNLAVDDVALGVVGHMDRSQVQDMLNNGEEIGGHSRTHLNLTALSDEDKSLEIGGSRKDLLDNNITPVSSFAYPYGAYDDSVKTFSANGGYTSARTVTPGFNSQGTDKFALYSQSVNSDTSLDTIKDWVQQAITEKSWLILTFHGINNDGDSYFAITPDKFQEIVDYLKSVNVKVVTVNEGLALMGASESEPELVSISITSPANKLEYTVGDALDISGLSITGLYSDNSTMSEAVSTANIFGFDSSAPAFNQVLTVNIKGKSTAYEVNINAQSNGGGDNSGDSGSGGGGSDIPKTFGGGGGTIVYCQEAKYVCINNVKNIVSQTPATCSFTSAQLSRIGESCEDNSGEQQVLGVQKYAIGTLLRSKLNHKIYVVTGETTIQYIPNLKKLAQYKDHLRLDVEESVIASFQQVLGTKIYADGTLVRHHGSPKIYVVRNGELVHIKTLKELLRYIGQPILEID